jgi:hypothetical protein
VIVRVDKEKMKFLRQVAKESGLTTEQFIQQILDVELTNIDIWLQRFDMTFSRKPYQERSEKQETTKKVQLACPDCNEPLKIKKNQLQCSNGHCDVIAVRSNGKIIRSSVPTGKPIF